MNKFHLIDINHGAEGILQDRIYKTAAQIAIKYGHMGTSGKFYNHDFIREFWKYDAPYPSFKYFMTHVKLPSIKWYIHNKITVEHPIWNANFLHGVVSHCLINWNEKEFASCEWHNNREMTDLIISSPFGGRIVRPENIQRHKWVNVPALHLAHLPDSVSFMAGIMAGVRIIEHNGLNYGVFSKRVLHHFKKWGIPIEETLNKGYRTKYLISPIWPALFVKYMPPEHYYKWINLQNPYNANIYAPILWKTYIDNYFAVNGIPYLKSRRMIYYEFDCEEGSMKRLNKLRVEKNLTELDNRIRYIVKEWGELERN